MGGTSTKRKVPSDYVLSSEAELSNIADDELDKAIRVRQAQQGDRRTTVQV